MSVIKPVAVSRTCESVLVDYLTKEFGQIVVASDDRIFINVFRRTIITENGLPSGAMAIVTNPDQVLRTVKEYCVKKKSVILFIQMSMDNVRMDDIIKQIAWKLSNCKIVVVATESEMHQLALLRELNMTETWIVKPVVINQLVRKVATIIRPHGGMEKLVKGAEECLQQGAYRHVLAICGKIFEKCPDNPVGFMLMGDAYKGLEQVDEMVEAYEHATYLDDLFLEPICRLVRYFHEKNDTSREVYYLEKLDALSPLNMERKLQIAKLHLELGQPDDAHGEFDAVMKMTAKKMAETISATAVRIGVICAEKGDPAAEKYFRKAIAAHGSGLDKSHIHLFNCLGIYLRKAGRFKEAAEEYQKALAIDETNDIINYNMALVHADMSDFETASSYLRRALRSNPEFCAADHVIACNAAMILMRNKETGEAKRYLDAALASRPDYGPALKLHAMLEKVG